MTLSDAEVKGAVESGWSSARHNQCPGLYCSKTADASKPIPYPPEQLATVHEGAGGGNIRFYFCDREGRVVHVATGFMDARRFRAEENFARSQLGVGAFESREFEKVYLEHELESADPKTRAVLDRRLRDLASKSIGRPVLDVLRDVEDDVYRKGAIG